MAAKSSVQNSESTNIFNNRAANLVSEVNDKWGDVYRKMGIPLFSIPNGQKPYIPALAAVLAPFYAKNPNILTDYVGLGWALEKQGFTATYNNMVRCALHSRLTEIDIKQIMDGKSSPIASSPTDWFPVSAADGEQILLARPYLVGGVNQTPTFLEYRKLFYTKEGEVKNTANKSLRTTVPGDSMWLRNEAVLNEWEARALHSSMMSAPLTAVPFTVKSMRLGDWWVNSPHLIVNNKLLTGGDRDKHIMEKLSTLLAVKVVDTYESPGDVLYMKNGNSSGAVVKKGYFLGPGCRVVFYHDSFYTHLPKGGAVEEIPHERIVAALLRAYFAWGFYSFDTMGYTCTAVIKNAVVGAVVVNKDGGQAYYLNEGDCCYVLLPNGKAIMFLRIKTGNEVAVRYNTFTGAIAIGGKRMGRMELIRTLLDFTGFSEEARIIKVLDKFITVTECEHCHQHEFTGHSCFLPEKPKEIPALEFFSMEDDNEAIVTVTPAQYHEAIKKKQAEIIGNQQQNQQAVAPAPNPPVQVDHYDVLGHKPSCVNQQMFSKELFLDAFEYWRNHLNSFTALRYEKGWNYWCSHDKFFVAVPSTAYYNCGDFWYYVTEEGTYHAALVIRFDHNFGVSDVSKWIPYFPPGMKGLNEMGDPPDPLPPPTLKLTPAWLDVAFV